MSNWSEKAARVNASQLRAFGQSVLLANPGAVPVAITAVRLQRQSIENETSGAYERIWTTTVQLPSSSVAGATVKLGEVEYTVIDVKPDEDPDSNGFTLTLNRRKPL